MATTTSNIVDSYNPSEELAAVVVPVNSWAAQFRLDYPEFASVATYPTVWINRWYTVAQKFLDPQRWCDSLNLGLELYVAHNIVIQAQNARATAAGGDPGLRTGVITSENSGDQSVSYDPGSSQEEGAGFWNKTTYGQQYYRLVKLFGAGSVYLGAGAAPCNGSTAAWSGPPPWPGWFSS